MDGYTAITWFTWHAAAWGAGSPWQVPSLHHLMFNTFPATPLAREGRRRRCGETNTWDV